MEPEVAVVRSSKGKHNSIIYRGVLETNAVTNLMGESLEEVSSIVDPQGPSLRVIHVNISILRVVGMGECSPKSIKRIAISMTVGDK